MPLRDALRGVATLVDATEDVLEPAAQLLPEPLRSRFKHSLDALEAAWKRLISAPTDAQQIQKASSSSLVQKPVQTPWSLCVDLSLRVGASQRYKHRSSTND